MSVDRTLKTHGGLIRHRNVLTRAERLEQLIEDDRWNEEANSVFALPKVVHRKSAVGKKDKKAKADEAEAGTEPAAPAPTEKSTK